MARGATPSTGALTFITASQPVEYAMHDFLFPGSERPSVGPALRGVDDSFREWQFAKSCHSELREEPLTICCFIKSAAGDCRK